MTKRLVHLIPTRDFYIPGVPAIEQDAAPERAAELLAYRPPAFSLEDPAGTIDSVGSSDTKTDTIPTTPGS